MLNLSKIIFGGASLAMDSGGYSLGRLKDVRPMDLILEAFNMGISCFDFAPIYGLNRAEIEMGKFNKLYRDKVTLISKAGVHWHSNLRVDMNNDPKIILKQFDQSLKNFNTDYIDIYFIHWPDKKVDIRRSIDVLYNLKEKGKIKHLGLSNTFEDDFNKALEVAPIEFIQGELNLFNQKSFKPNNTYFMNWGSLDKGILSSRVSLGRKFEAEDARSHAFWWKKSNWKEKVRFVEKLKIKYKLSDNELKKIALQYVLNNSDSSIIGFKSIEQLHEIINISLIDEKSHAYDEVINEFSLF